MNGDDYVIDGDLAFSNSRDALKFYQTEYHKQQAEIEALKMDIHSLTYGERIAKYFNEPVAWIDKNTGKPKMEGFIKTDYDIPLYTHPIEPAICVGYWDYMTGAFHKNITETQQKRIEAGFLKPVYTHPAKTLTDEEIREFMAGMPHLTEQKDLLMFARAILRKAGEK
jgi:hypothetical protein